MLIVVICLFLAMVIHEFSHGWVAYKLGDPTAWRQGRLTLNPLVHIDIFGTIVFPILVYITTGGRAIFAWAKPVPINFYALGNPKRDIALVGIAGPLSNFLFAAALSVLIRFIENDFSLFYIFLNYLAWINLMLCVFNLIPIPPLDGSRVLFGLLPKRLEKKLIALEPYGFLIIILAFWAGFFRYAALPLVRILANTLGIAMEI